MTTSEVDGAEAQVSCMDIFGTFFRVGLLTLGGGLDMKKLLNVVGFEWDGGNIDKNWIKHGVSPSECEQMFFNQPLVVAEDSIHSEAEERLFALGRTDADRLLFVVFTVRKDKVRIISARDMSSKEKKVYKQYESQ